MEIFEFEYCKIAFKVEFGYNQKKKNYLSIVKQTNFPQQYSNEGNTTPISIYHNFIAAFICNTPVEY